MNHNMASNLTGRAIGVPSGLSVRKQKEKPNKKNYDAVHGHMRLQHHALPSGGLTPTPWCPLERTTAWERPNVGLLRTPRSAGFPPSRGIISQRRIQKETNEKHQRLEISKTEEKTRTSVVIGCPREFQWISPYRMSRWMSVKRGCL